jgi:hypothetical protein
MGVFFLRGRAEFILHEVHFAFLEFVDLRLVRHTKFSAMILSNIFFLNCPAVFLLSHGTVLLASERSSVLFCYKPFISVVQIG